MDQNKKPAANLNTAVAHFYSAPGRRDLWQKIQVNQFKVKIWNPYFTPYKTIYLNTIPCSIIKDIGVLKAVDITVTLYERLIQCNEPGVFFCSPQALYMAQIVNNCNIIAFFSPSKTSLL